MKHKLKSERLTVSTREPGLLLIEKLSIMFMTNGQHHTSVLPCNVREEDANALCVSFALASKRFD